MAKFDNIGKTKGFLAIVLASTCLWGTNAYAATDGDAVKAAVAGYHAALGTKDPAKLDAFWVHDDSVTDIEPSPNKNIAVGWKAVKKSIEGYIPVVAALKIVQAEGPYVQVKGDLALSIGIATAAVKLNDGKEFSQDVFETDVLEKHDGAWLLVSHSAAQVPQ